MNFISLYKSQIIKIEKLIHITDIYTNITGNFIPIILWFLWQISFSITLLLPAQVHLHLNRFQQKKRTKIDINFERISIQ